MAIPRERKLVLVTRRTRLEELVARYHSVAQARFYIEHLGADFSDYLAEHDTYTAARTAVLAVLEAHGRYQTLDRAFLPNFVFAADDIVIALGQDGLVANIVKYLDGQPVIGLNPDPHRWDGVLLPFEPRDLRPILAEVLLEHRAHQTVSMAEATLSDGQRLLAVNDLFIGPKSHTSARYEIASGERSEVQSSSGIIVATGLGSTAWIKSIVTGSLAIATQFAAAGAAPRYASAPWDAPYLQYAVREPFPSRSSQASMVFGRIAAGSVLTLRSLMPENGVIFSDGIEADYVAFNSGVEAKIALAAKQGRIIV
ncbi:MAG: sugar kinase [Rhodocyclales bacterium]|nr:sugar kinase [Rhodocyclales bacterium]